MRGGASIKYPPSKPRLAELIDLSKKTILKHVANSRTEIAEQWSKWADFDEKGIVSLNC